MCVCVEVSCFHVSVFAYVYVLCIICVGVRDRETHLKSVAVLVFLKRVVFLFFLPMCMWFVQVCDQRAHVGVQRGAEVRTMTDMSVFVSPLLLELQAVLLRNINCQTLCQRNPL